MSLKVSTNYSSFHFQNYQKNRKKLEKPRKDDQKVLNLKKRLVSKIQSRALIKKLSYNQISDQ